MVTGKNIRTKVAAGDSGVSDLLDNRPPIGFEQNGILQPVADELLAGFWSSGIAKPGSEGNLIAAGNLNCSLQRSNVALIHEHPKYTNRFVSATTPFVWHGHKEACTVLDMPTTARKTAARPPIAAPKARSKKRQAKPGSDGRTLGTRLGMAMAHETGRRRSEYTQADLLADVNRLAQAPEDKPLLSQQMLSAIMVNKVTRSSFSHLMAAACHVNPLWLSDGIGNMTD